MNQVKIKNSARGRCSIHGEAEEFFVISIHGMAISLKGCPDCYVDWQRNAFSEFVKANGRTWEKVK